MKYKKLVAPFRREIWEYKSAFFASFLAFGGLIVLLTLYAALTSDDLSLHIRLDEHDFEDGMQFGESLREKIQYALGVFVSVILNVFVYLSGLVSIYYLLGALYDDRKDRSILFWKSLPVSETQSVLTKYITGLLVVPAIALVIGLFTSIVLVAIVSFWLPAIVDFGFWEVWSEVRFFAGFWDAVLLILLTTIWFAPFAGWLLFASAIAQRSPLLWAVAPPLVIALAEKLIYGRSMLVQALNYFLPDFEHFESGDISYSLFNKGDIVLQQISSPQLLIAVILSAVFIALCVWLRNNRYEI